MESTNTGHWAGWRLFFVEVSLKMPPFSNQSGVNIFPYLEQFKLGEKFGAFRLVELFFLWLPTGMQAELWWWVRLDMKTLIFCYGTKLISAAIHGFWPMNLSNLWANISIQTLKQMSPFHKASMNFRGIIPGY